MITMVIALLTAGTAGLARILYASWWSPPGVFALIWGGSLGLLHLTVEAQVPLQDYTWCIIVTAWLAFLLGALLAGPARPAAPAAGRRFQPPALLEPAVKITGLLALGGCMRFAWVAVDQIGFYQYLAHPLAVRHELTMGGVSTGILTPVFQGVTLGSAALGGTLAAIRPRSLMAYAGPVAAAIYDVFSFGRAHTLVTLLIYGSSFLLARAANGGSWRIGRRKKAWGLALAALAVAAPYAYVTAVRERPSVEGTSAVVETYLANISHNWYLVDDVVSRRDPPTPGVNTMLPALLVMHKFGLRTTDPRLEQLFTFSSRHGTGRLSNTYTVVGVAYADFGLAGLAIYMFVLGLLANLLFVLYQRKPRLWHIAGLSFVYPMLVFTTQGHQLNSPPFLLGLIGSVVLAFLLTHLPRSVCSRVRPAYSEI